eukprot:IDg22548t1
MLPLPNGTLCSFASLVCDVPVSGRTVRWPGVVSSTLPTMAGRVWYYRTVGEREYCRRLAALLWRNNQSPTGAVPSAICLGVRFPRDWRYLSYDRGAVDALSGFLGDLRWAWKRKNETGVFLDYHNKEIDYLLGPVRQRLYATIPDDFRREFCPPTGFWLCLPPVLTYRAEVLVDGETPWSSLEGMVFRQEYAALYAV